MDWRECCEKMIVKKVSLDEGLISSLLMSSANKAESENRLEMSDITAASKLSLAYDSLRELLEALALRHRYKIYNHECYSAFLKEMLKEHVIGEEFNDIRRIRNAVNYYGKSVSPEETQQLIERMQSLRNRIATLVKRA